MAVTSARHFRPKSFSFAIALHPTCLGGVGVKAKWMQNQIGNMRNILPHVFSIVPKMLGIQLIHLRHCTFFRIMRVHAVVVTSSKGNIVRVTGLFMRGTHRSPVDCPYKGQWGGALISSLMCAWTNSGANNRDAGNYDINAIVCAKATWLIRPWLYKKQLLLLMFANLTTFH